MNEKKYLADAAESSPYINTVSQRTSIRVYYLYREACQYPWHPFRPRTLYFSTPWSLHLMIQQRFVFRIYLSC